MEKLSKKIDPNSPFFRIFAADELIENMTRKLVIFDLDGTLLNTYADIAAATNHALTLHGYPNHSVEVIRSFVGNGINKLFERALPEGHKAQEEVLAIRADFVPYYNAHGTEKTFVFDGMRELIDRLTAEGVKVAVASNKYQEATRHLIPYFFPGVNFSAIFGQRDGIPTKPDPQIVYDIMRESGIEDAREVLYVGDSEVDMETAHNAGVDGVGVTWGCKTRELLASHKPYAIVDRAEEILPLLNR